MILHPRSKTDAHIEEPLKNLVRTNEQEIEYSYIGTSRSSKFERVQISSLLLHTFVPKYKR